MVCASTGAMNSLLGKLATLMGEEYAKLKNLRKEVKFINDELIGMKDALEGLSYQDELDPQTKRWRDIVREMSYDIEDIIDDFMQNIGGSSKTTGFVSNTIERLKTLRARHKIAGQIEDIRNLVIETSARRQRYKLDTSLSSDVVIDPRVVTLYENAANLVGLEAPTSELVNFLADDNQQLKMVSIVGFGGLGKTTLANVVYGRLKGKFNQCAFVPVSQKPNVPKLLHSLLSQLGSTKYSHDSELNVLLDQLREHLQNNRYLVVIDDIWDVQAWSVIKCAFPENDLGSRVIVTTRIQGVAKTCCSNQYDQIFNMKALSKENSRRLFIGRIFGSEEACPHQLSDVSEEILKKCGGLPLAIISISSMLASEGSNQKQRWELVRDSLRSGTNLTLEGVRQILNLSYKDLPCRLKTCLLYLGMYPEDYAIDRSELEHQWIAEGFVSKENGQDMKKIAENYFNELVNRSLIQPTNFDFEGSVTECKVHDMMLDLILLKSAEENFLTIVDGPQAITGLDYKVRRLSLRFDHTSNAEILLGSISMIQVRSVMIFGSSWNAPLSEFKFLRVLFVDSDNEVNFNGLGKLYLLKYFCDRGDSSSFPSDAVHLPHLLHLSIGSNSMLPDGISNMKSLLSLSGFNITVHSQDDIMGLGELTSIRTLTVTGYSIDDLDELASRIDDLGSSLRKLSRLESLYLYPSLIEMDGLFASSPLPCSLQKLHTLQHELTSWFSRVPNLIREHHNLRDLQLHVIDLHREDVGILADLPSLVILELMVINDLKQMIVINGGFPVLKCFGLDQNRASYLTFNAGAMPKLQILKLTSDNIRYLPAGIEHLPALEKLFAHIKYYFQTESKRRVTESVLRSYISIHPGNPSLEVYFSN